jgi:hypothetical protein
MPRHAGRLLALAGLLTLALVHPGCATLDALAQLPQIDFHLDRATRPTLAGIDLRRVERAEDLRAADLLAVGLAVRRGELPLRFDLHVGADNPSTNRYDLRLDRLEWTLLLEDRETVSGIVDRSFVIAPGATTDIPIGIELDLMRFFDGGAQDLARLAVRAVGGGEPVNLRLRARPTVRTPLGLVRFPNEITILHRSL